MSDECKQTEPPEKKHRKIDVLEVHGTTITSLTPGAIRGAAVEDLKRKVRNAERGAAGGPDPDDGYEMYAFHRRHVHKAATTKGLIELALGDRDIGCVSGKKNTRMIYRDQALLEQAKEIS